MDLSLFLAKQAGLVERLLILSSADIPFFSGRNRVTAKFVNGSISAPVALRACSRHSPSPHNSRPWRCSNIWSHDLWCKASGIIRA